MAANAKDLLINKCYRSANGGDIEELKKLLKDEKSKNPKRIPYFFSASKQLPGKFCLGYQPGSKPRVEYLTVTPDGFRYRNQIHDNVNGLIKWFKEHYQDPIPRPIQTNTSSHTTPMSGSQIPSHITRNLDYSQLQAAVNTANQRSATSNTPYTPSHLAYSSSTPTPQYGHAQHYNTGYGGQRGPSGGPSYKGSRQHYVGQFGGRSNTESWRSGGWGSLSGPPRTPSQTPGRTPLYTPTQTPHSVSSLYGTPPPGSRGGGHGHHGNLTPHRRHMEQPGTPVLDE